MNRIDFSLLLNGYPILKAKKKLIEINNDLTSASILNRRNEILDFHLNNNNFYREFVNSKIDVNTPWEQLPILTKKNLQIPLKKRISKGFSINKVFKNKTSGSSGVPLDFAKDKSCHALVWANIAQKFDEHSIYAKKQARFYGMPKLLLPKLMVRVKDFFLNRYRFDVFDLSDRALSRWIVDFKKNKYTHLNGYTTVIVLFSKYLINENIVLKSFCPTLKNCVVTSEMCSEEDILIMEKALGVPVINEYGISELDLIAFTNKQGNWKLNTATLYVEILDDNNTPLPNNCIGRIVVTSLFNKAHPFIRYDTGDRGAIGVINNEKILEKIEGRKDDLIYLPSGKIAAGMTFYNFTKSIMSKYSNIKELKAIQEKIDVFRIFYVANDDLNETEIKNLKKELCKFLELGIEIVFIRRDYLKRSKSGKLKQFKSLLKN